MYFRFATPPTPRTSCMANHLLLAALPMHNRVQWWLTQKWRTQTTRTNTKHRQFRRGWRSNFSPLTWCNTGPYSGKRRAARGAPQMLHTQEEEERQKCIIKKKKHLNEDCNVRLCTTVIRSVSAACLKSSALFMSPFYITIPGHFTVDEIGGEKQRLCLLLVAS